MYDEDVFEIIKLKKENGCKFFECKVIEESIKLRKKNKELKSELETYKKIAEKLAKYFIDYVKSNVRIENYIPPTIEELLDWARKEVENGN